MKTNGILTALKFDRNKNTAAFAAKLSSYFLFAKEIKADIKEVAITETDLSLNEAGKLKTEPEMKKEYVSTLLHKYCFSDKGYKELNNSHNNLRNVITQKQKEMRKLIKKAKDVIAIDAEIDQLNADLAETRAQRLKLKTNEQTRLMNTAYSVKLLRKELSLMKGSRIMIDTANGLYSFVVPIDNKFYSAFCDLLGLYNDAAKVEKKEPIQRIVTLPNVMDKIKKAARFTGGKNEMRPVFECICLDFSKDGLQVVATDAHKLYYSSYIELAEINNGNGWQLASKAEPMQLLIAPESIQALIKSKVEDKPFEIDVYGEDAATINGIEVNLLAGVKYPEYRVVIPEYSQKMTFDRKELIQITKQLLPFATSTSRQIRFHLNGNIEASAEGIYFKNELTKQMKYSSKDFEDTDIAFNGSFLIESLNVLETNEVSMYSNGNPNKGAIFTDQTDNILLMPLMLNY